MSEHPTIEEVYKRPEYFDAVWSKSIEYYGVTKQSIVCMEECAELIEAYVDILPRMNAGDSRISRFGFLFDTTKQEGRGR